jgi:RNA polymerase sigma-70 factor (ECF subfamily)
MPAAARRTHGPSDPEARLMLRVRCDEPGAFAELVQQIRGRVFAHIFKSVQDRQEAEDLTQDVLLRLYRSRKRYEPRAKFSTWLYHITQNVARNGLRSRRRRRWLHFGRLSEEAASCTEPMPRLEPSADPLERHELAQVVRTAVAGLMGKQRAAFELQQYHDQSYADIARALALSPKAAKSLLYRARIHLRDLLSDYVNIA